jgi:hypothetical protein
VSDSHVVREPYDVNDRQFAAVAALEGRERFEHLLKRICDTEIVFLVVDDDGELIVLKDKENPAPAQVPIWPHPRYAEAYRASLGGGADYGSIELTEFVEDLLPYLSEEGIQLVVMPTEEGRALAIAADELRKSIISYHDEWYGGWPKYSSM